MNTTTMSPEMIAELAIVTLSRSLEAQDIDQALALMSNWLDSPAERETIPAMAGITGQILHLAAKRMMRLTDPQQWSEACAVVRPWIAEVRHQLTIPRYKRRGRARHYGAGV
jgi:UDP:flavonoid glycosyltransferase YjiC (YdhE family)